MTDKNMVLWNKVCETNPAHTKEVKLGRKITAIDPMQQIMNTTQQFGAATQSWGFQVMDKVFMATDQVAVLVRFWTTDKECYVEQWGQNGLYIDNAKKKPDTDCMKKATTDGLTKCLTYLGFNADVFLGKFDDNKYVEEMRKKHAEPDLTPEQRATQWVDRAISCIAKSDNIEALNTWFPKQSKALELVNKFEAEKVRFETAFANKTNELTPAIAAE